MSLSSRYAFSVLPAHFFFSIISLSFYRSLCFNEYYYYNIELTTINLQPSPSTVLYFYLYLWHCSWRQEWACRPQATRAFPWTCCRRGWRRRHTRAAACPCGSSSQAARASPEETRWTSGRSSAVEASAPSSPDSAAVNTRQTANQHVGQNSCTVHKPQPCLLHQYSLKNPVSFFTNTDYNINTKGRAIKITWYFNSTSNQVRHKNMFSFVSVLINM